MTIAPARRDVSVEISDAAELLIKEARRKGVGVAFGSAESSSQC